MTRRCLLRGARFSCTYGTFASHGRGVRCRPRAAERRDAPKDSERMPSSHRRQAQRSNRTDCLLSRRSTPSKIRASHAPAAPDTSPTPNRRKQKASPTVFEGYLFCQSIRSILFLLISAKRRQRDSNRTHRLHDRSVWQNRCAFQNTSAAMPVLNGKAAGAGR